MGDDSRVDLVFEGGGVKGIGLAGAYRELCARGYEPQCVAGTSAGAITAALVAAGYSGAELEQVVLHEMDFKSFADRGRLAWAGLVGDGIEILRRHGIHSGDSFLAWIRQALAAKGIHTFADLRDDDATEERRRYRLQLIASDLTDASMLVLPRDAPRLGLDPDALDVAEAVRMSMSIPIFFEPWIHTNPQSARRHVIVDGGILSNFPVWLFDVPADQLPAFPTIGLLLVAPDQRNPIVAIPDSDTEAEPASSLTAYVKALADTAMEAHDRFYIQDESFARTIPIPTLGVRTTEFGIVPERAAALFESGRRAAADFFDGWDFKQYVEKYRSGSVPEGSRRRDTQSMPTIPVPPAP
jgi:NTE family protein